MEENREAHNRLMSPNGQDGDNKTHIKQRLPGISTVNTLVPCWDRIIFPYSSFFLSPLFLNEIRDIFKIVIYTEVIKHINKKNSHGLTIHVKEKNLPIPFKVLYHTLLPHPGFHQK